MPHGDHFDRVPVWDATRSNHWENEHHYGGGYGGRWLLSKTHGKKSEHKHGDKHQESTAAAAGKEGGKSRSLLGTQEWGSGELAAHPTNCVGCPVQLASAERLTTSS